MNTPEFHVSPRVLSITEKLSEINILAFITQLFILAYKELSTETLDTVDFDKYYIYHCLKSNERVQLIKYIRQISYAETPITIRIPTSYSMESTFKKLPSFINIPCRSGMALKHAKDIADLLFHNYYVLTIWWMEKLRN